MTCDQAIELLPWLLNGTLEAADREEVRRHLEACEACREALADTRTAWGVFDQHLPSDTLVALAYGESPAGFDPTVADRHLASCPQCTAELELARTSRRLEEADNLTLFPAAETPGKTREGRKGWRAAAIAAGLAGLIAAGGWIQEDRRGDALARELARQETREETPGPGLPASDDSAERQKLAELEKRLAEVNALQADVQKKAEMLLAQGQHPSFTEPHINTPNPELYSAQEVLRDNTTSPEVVLEQDEIVSAVLHPTDGAPSYPGYEIEIADAGGKPIWRNQGLRRDEMGDFTLTLPAGYLQVGRHTIQVFGLDGAKRGKLVGSYEVTVK